MSAELGGIEKSLVTFLQYLVSLPATEVTLMLWKKRGELLPSIPNEVKVVDAPTPGNLKTVMKKTSLKHLLLYMKLKYYTHKNRPWNAFPKQEGKYDIAIAYSQDGYSPYYIMDKVVATRKFMWYHHGTYLHTGTLKDIDALYYPKFTSVIPVSESIKETLIKEFPTTDIKYTVIPNLLNVDEIIAKSKQSCQDFEISGCLKLVTVGRLSQEKGQLRALDVAKELKEQGVTFLWLFVGGGSDKEACIQKVNDLGLTGCVRFVGVKSNPYPYISHADIYVAPSYVEADPVTIQEAIILNKPIVASNIPAIVKAMEVANYQGTVNFDDAHNVANHIMIVKNQNYASNHCYKLSSRNTLVVELIKDNILL
ncbi:glycosyltransferase [Bacteroides acidifaciens]|uniref:glycosyltransferase n=1 Tax=Bacteroides acidifaciens TaxID=85831 RepID=UPI002588033A|nr:glycosyltransferase [Bacteroides acidifaciens]